MLVRTFYRMHRWNYYKGQKKSESAVKHHIVCNTLAGEYLRLLFLWSIHMATMFINVINILVVGGNRTHVVFLRQKIDRVRTQGLDPVATHFDRHVMPELDILRTTYMKRKVKGWVSFAGRHKRSGIGKLTTKNIPGFDQDEIVNACQCQIQRGTDPRDTATENSDLGMNGGCLESAGQKGKGNKGCYFHF